MDGAFIIADKSLDLKDFICGLNQLGVEVTIFEPRPGLSLQDQIQAQVLDGDACFVFVPTLDEQLRNAVGLLVYLHTAKLICPMLVNGATWKDLPFAISGRMGIDCNNGYPWDKIRSVFQKRGKPNSAPPFPSNEP